MSKHAVWKPDVRPTAPRIFRDGDTGLSDQSLPKGSYHLSDLSATLGGD